jgi:hypothetical protein
VGEFVRARVEDLDESICFRREEEPVLLKVHREMIKVTLLQSR